MLIFNIKNNFQNLTIFLFIFFITSATLAQSTSSFSCEQTNTIYLFKKSLIAYANELENLNVDEIKKYLDQQILENNNQNDTTNIKKTIYSSLTIVETYKDLSKVYLNNINQYDYYEYFTSQVFCKHIKNLKTVDTSVIFEAANTLLERNLIEKFITPYNNKTLISKNSSHSGGSGETKKNRKIIKSNPMLPLTMALSAKPPDSKPIRRWEVGVSTSTYNTDTYEEVRASEDWTDLNNNLDGESGTYNFRWYWEPKHPYETIGADDAYAYGFTGKGQVIAIHDSEFCSSPHIDIKTKHSEGRITSYNWGDWWWCTSNNYHGVSVFGYAAGEFHNDSENEEDSIMGVAYNADLHLADYWGSNGMNWEPTIWADNLDHAKESGAVVQNNSWGFDDDLNPDVIKNYMDANNKTLAEALVHYQGIKTEGLNGRDTTFDIGSGTSQVNWTTDDWNTFFDSINSFQETGVYVYANSNDNYGAMGVVNCIADIDGNKQCRSNPTITADTSAGIVYLLPSLRDAYINVVNVLNYGFTNDYYGGQQMWSAPCGQTGKWCVSGDGVHVPALAYRLDENDTDSRYLYEGYGTSYAAPMISGAVAIMAEAFPTLSPSEWTQRLFATANNSWFNNTNCFDWDLVTDSSLVTKREVGDEQTGQGNWTDLCGGIDGYAVYGDGVAHAYNQIYGHGFPDLKKALEPIRYKKIKVRNTQYALAASTIFLSGLTYQNLNFDGVQGQFHDALYTGFNFKMDDLVKQPIRRYHSRHVNSLDNSSRKQWMNSIVNENTDLHYAISYTDIEEDEYLLSTDISSPEITSLSFNISNDINTATNLNYKISSSSLLGFNIGERPLQNFIVNGGQQDFLPFTTAMNNGYSVVQQHLLDNQNKMSYTFYQGEHNYTEKIESGFLLNFSNFDLENHSYLNAYTGYNIEDSTFLRNQTSGAFGETKAYTYHTGFSYENNFMNDFYFGSSLNLGYTTTAVSENSLMSSVDPLITSQYIIGLVEKNIINQNDSLSFNISQPLSIESGNATFKIPYYFNESNNGFNEQKIDMSIKDRFNKLNLDYIYNFSDNNQLHAGISVGTINFNELDNPSFMVNYKLFF